MPYTYKRHAEATVAVDARALPGLPKDIALEFNRFYIRIYKSKLRMGFFSCSLAIPSQKDSEGYALEIGFLDPLESERLDNHPENGSTSFEEEFDFRELAPIEYECPLNEHDFKSITHSISCDFRDTKEQGRRLLLLEMTIKGTPFRGYALIDSALYG